MDLKVTKIENLLKFAVAPSLLLYTTTLSYYSTTTLLHYNTTFLSCISFHTAHSKVCLVEKRVKMPSHGRKKDPIWIYFEEMGAELGKTCQRVRCKTCKKPVQKLVARMKTHYDVFQKDPIWLYFEQIDAEHGQACKKCKQPVQKLVKQMKTHIKCARKKKWSSRTNQLIHFQVHQHHRWHRQQIH